jgi:hypothetical protein
VTYLSSTGWWQMRRSLRDFLADPGHWAGYTSDPAETETGTAWLYLGKLELYAWRWNARACWRATP